MRAKMDEIWRYINNMKDENDRRLGYACYIGALEAIVEMNTDAETTMARLNNVLNSIDYNIAVTKARR